ncbi:DNA mismatch repair protein MutL [Capnocytophaga granulosa]|uniref:DNA mismatch repair protein MutL n=1 Tax=Capnocytophaga granulosa TaxID=45242 RepID=A0A1H2UD17_9FLAO|nr:DNA mismatch repair endonuclease MutL [Capnocytophaga granulosa]EPD28797.1 DNA mismatch repair protein MutL [Capnocytophaga granulosa ATCC 51502]SDW54016.1 DNA mismatch repair protein MutL [Capnocytophaga granulosa]SUX16541.1 DNA mismatch repair protein mutL [Capnocytophaga granulosa]
MPDIIRLLPDNVANQIAAGEVIQRPASAVKELLENAIDAGATQIKLYLKDAGRTLVQVVDNGIGMSPTDARLAFERHATSKIRSADDLFTLHTKGFRGEALASIASIAQVELITCQEGQQVGTSLKIEGNKITEQTPMVASRGTSIAMKHLFFNVPARRNFLKSDTVEMRHILDEFHRVVLAHPDLQFSLFHNDVEQFALPATTLRKRIVQLFGQRLNEQLIPVEENTELLRIHGFISKDSYKKNKSLQFFMVNQRFIKNRYLHHAVVSAFEGLLKEGEQPEYFLHLEIDPKHIDINIHPTKTEIKFDNDQAIYALLRSAIKHSLGQFHVLPSIDFSLDEQNEVPYSYKDKEAQTPVYHVDRNFNPFKMDTPTPEAPKQAPTSYPKGQPSPQWEQLYTGIPSKANAPTEEDITDPFAAFQQESRVQTSLYFQRKYLITFFKDKVLFVHVARAHQRILYERFRRTMLQGHSLSQSLLFPLEFEYTPSEILALEPMLPELRNAGFMIEIAGNLVRFTGLPPMIKESQVQGFLYDLLERAIEDIPQEIITQEEMLAKILAKNLAIRAGQTLSGEEQEQLVYDLFTCQEPQLSPFGKKTYTEMTVSELESRL